MHFIRLLSILMPMKKNSGFVALLSDQLLLTSPKTEHASDSPRITQWMWNRPKVVAVMMVMVVLVGVKVLGIWAFRLSLVGWVESRC